MGRIRYFNSTRTLSASYRFALDDFGSGMDSFAYLKHLPINFIKIDGSFVHDMTRNPLSREIVESIHKIARVMKIATIAEHAEDQETLEALKTIGIDYVQGYIIDDRKFSLLIGPLVEIGILFFTQPLEIPGYQPARE